MVSIRHTKEIFNQISAKTLYGGRAVQNIGRCTKVTGMSEVTLERFDIVTGVVR